VVLTGAAGLARGGGRVGSDGMGGGWVVGEGGEVGVGCE
jgi:hypothetical protein